jgi:hypothetical protein
MPRFVPKFLAVSALSGCAHRNPPARRLAASTLSPASGDLAQRVDRALLRHCPLPVAGSQQCSPLKDQIAALGIPGVSIAVFDEQSVLWLLSLASRAFLRELRSRGVLRRIVERMSSCRLFPDSK